MTLEQPLFIDGNNYSGIELRALLEGLFNEGVIRGNDFKVQPRAAGANMTVEVLPGRVAIQSDTAGGGVYLARSTATEPVPNPSGTFTAAPGAGLTRIDVVYARVVTGNLTLGVAQGTAAASPTIPAVPSDAVALGRVTLPSGTGSIGAAQITDMRTWAGPMDSLPKGGSLNLGYQLNPPLTFVTYNGSTLVIPLGTHPRRILVQATLSCRCQIDAGTILFEGYVDLSIDRGATFTAGPIMSGRVVDSLSDQPWVAQHFVTGIPPTPTPGQNVEVHARAAIRRVNAGNNIDFDMSTLNVVVLPA